MHYRGTPFSPNELFNGHQIWCRIDTILPSPAHLSQAKQSSQARPRAEPVTKLTSQFSDGSACYALYCGPHRNKDSGWVFAGVTNILGPLLVSVHVLLKGPTWRSHVDQLQPHCGMEEDDDPGEMIPMPCSSGTEAASLKDDDPEDMVLVPNIPSTEASSPVKPEFQLKHLNDEFEYGRHNPRHSERLMSETKI